MRNWIRLNLAVLLTMSVGAGAQSLFNFNASTPEGSWALREITSTDNKGRRTVSIMKQKFLATEQRQGQTYYWLESEIDNFKLDKKDQRKRDGDHMVLKVLVTKEAMNSDPANVVNNLPGFGKEIIMQAGDNAPMMMTEAGMLGGVMMQSLGIKTDYAFTSEGSETVDTAAGKFATTKVSGTGSTSSKILFKTINVQSRSTVWLSDDVPFGVVKGESTDLVNGQEQKSQIELIKFGKSGAVTAISGEIQRMPF